MDNRVITLDDDENHIQGKGYIGGIVGRMSSSNLYNSYVQGKIGGIGAALQFSIVTRPSSPSTAPTIPPASPFACTRPDTWT